MKFSTRLHNGTAPSSAWYAVEILCQSNECAGAAAWRGGSEVAKRDGRLAGSAKPHCA